MNDQEMSAWLAVNLMGWELNEYTVHWGKEKRWDGSETEDHSAYTEGHWTPAWNRNMTAEAEEQILELGLVDMYSYELAEVYHGRHPRRGSDFGPHLIGASAWQRCEAMYAIRDEIAEERGKTCHG